MSNFEKFDRRLARLRDEMAYATVTLNCAAPRYIAMMEAISAAFLLVYENMAEQDQKKMREAFDDLTDTVTTAMEEWPSPSDNISPLKK